jgi:3-deoxy-7-phosphoheptulonate synthase
MIITMRKGAPREQIDHVIDRVRALGFDPRPIFGVERTVVAAVGDERGKFQLESLASAAGVEKVTPILQPFKLVGSEVQPEPSTVEIAGVKFGGGYFGVIAGPCSVESREQVLETARAVKRGGAHLLRGGAFKPRTSPYSFQGLAEEGLKLLAEARAETGLGVVTEVMNPRDIEVVVEYADAIQLGARNMQNFSLLREVGQARKPVVLKRGMSATIEEWLMSAEYLVSEGNENVLLCERGIRTFETHTRNTFDLSAIPAVHGLSHLPVVADPSHGTGVREMVIPMAKASVAAGADGLMVEVHPNPEEAFVDGAQSLPPEQFEEMMQSLEGYLDLEKQEFRNQGHA